jgi:hypothetical protein
MHGPINVKSHNNISKWQMGINSAFKGLNYSADKAHKPTRKKVIRPEETIALRKGDFIFHLHVE